MSKIRNDEDMIKTLRKHGLGNPSALGYHAGWCDVIADRLEELLTQSQPIGNWRETGRRTPGGQYVYSCSCCGRTVNSYKTKSGLVPEEYPFCHCGAKMSNI